MYDGQDLTHPILITAPDRCVNTFSKMARDMQAWILVLQYELNGVRKRRVWVTALGENPKATSGPSMDGWVPLAFAL